MELFGIDAIKLVGLISASGILTGLVTIIATKMQSKSTLRAAIISANTQLETTVNQITSHANIEQRKILYADQQLARRKLTGWLHSLQVDLDSLWSDLCHEGGEYDERAGEALNKIPWEYRRLPREVAETRYLWSNETRKNFEKIWPILYNIHDSGTTALNYRKRKTEEDPSRYNSDKKAQATFLEYRGGVWDGMNDLERFRAEIDECLESETIATLKE